MPLVTVKLIEGVFNQNQKQEMIRKLTDAMVSIEGENLRQVTWVVIEEVQSGDWGIGGNSLSKSDVQRLAAEKPKAAPPIHLMPQTLLPANAAEAPRNR
jgi:4-oxalocrotonate tautomerase